MKGLAQLKLIIKVVYSLSVVAMETRLAFLQPIILFCLTNKNCLEAILLPCRNLVLTSLQVISLILNLLAQTTCNKLAWSS